MEAAGEGGAEAGAGNSPIAQYLVDAPVQWPLLPGAPCAEGSEAEDDRLRRQIA